MFYFGERMSKCKHGLRAEDLEILDFGEEEEREELILELADIFKILSDPTRLKILLTLLKQKELAVCCLSESVKMSVSAVSHQLRLLRGAKLVKFRREGKNIFYSLDDEHVYLLLAQALEHILEER